MKKLIFTLSLIAIGLSVFGHKILAQIEKAPGLGNVLTCPSNSGQITRALDGTYTQVGFSVVNGMKPAKFTVTIANGIYKIKEQFINSEEQSSNAVIKTGAHPEFVAVLAGRALDNSCLFSTEMDLKTSGQSMKLTIVQQWSRDDSPRVTFYLVPTGAMTPQTIIQLYDNSQQDAVNRLWQSVKKP